MSSVYIVATPPYPREWPERIRKKLVGMKFEIIGGSLLEVENGKQYPGYEVEMTEVLGALDEENHYDVVEIINIGDPPRRLVFPDEVCEHIP